MKKSEFIGRITSFSRQMAEELWDDIHSDNDMLCVWNVPDFMMPWINQFNKENPKDAINITNVCVKALEKEITLKLNKKSNELKNWCD